MHLLRLDVHRRRGHHLRPDRCGVDVRRLLRLLLLVLLLVLLLLPLALLVVPLVLAVLLGLLLLTIRGRLVLGLRRARRRRILPGLGVLLLRGAVPLLLLGGGVLRALLAIRGGLAAVPVWPSEARRARGAVTSSVEGRAGACGAVARADGADGAREAGVLV